MNTDPTSTPPPATETESPTTAVAPATDRLGQELPDFIDDPRGGKDRHGNPVKIPDPNDPRTRAYNQKRGGA